MLNMSSVTYLCVCHCPQVIEVLIRSEEGLSRDMVKHLNSIEEQILESLAWTRNSALWSALEASENKVPTCEEVCDLIPVRGNSCSFSQLFYTENCSNETITAENLLLTEGKLLSYTDVSYSSGNISQ